MLVRCSLIVLVPGTDCLLLFRDMICIALTMLFSVATASAMRMDACYCMASSISAPAPLPFHGGYASVVLETDSQSCSGGYQCLLTHLCTPQTPLLPGLAEDLGRSPVVSMKICSVGPT